MANTLYNKFKENLLSAGLNLTTLSLKFVAVDVTGGAANYIFDINHNFLDSVVAGARRATSPALAGKTILNGTFDANDVINAFPSLSGAAIEAVILYVDTGVDATSRLIAYFDTGGGLPFSPTGNNTDLVFNAAGIFSL